MIGISGGEFGVRRPFTAYDMKARQERLAGYTDGTGRPARCSIPKDHRSRQACRQGFLAQDLERRPMEDRRRHHWGWYSFDPALNLVYYGTGNPDLEPEAAPGRQQVVHDDLRARSRYRHGRWVYQMTPHDEWDYDGVNEMILADQQFKGAGAQASDAFRPQRLRLHARS